MILVMGSTGTTGSAVVRSAAARGLDVRAFARDEDKARALFGDTVPVVEGDMLKPGTLEDAMEGIDSLFLMSSPTHDQVEAQCNVASAAKAAGVTHIVKLSVIGVGPESPLNLGRWHHQIEAFVDGLGVPYTHLRPGSFMQNLLASAPTIREQNTLYGAVGDGANAMIDARDIADVAVTILADPTGHQDQAYTLTGGQAFTYGDAAATLSEVLDREIAFVPTSPEDARASMKQVGLPEWLIDDLIVLAEMQRAGHMSSVSPTVQELLGRKPRTFQTFVQDHAEAFGG